MGGKTYVCKSPAYASMIQRASSTLDFDHLVVVMTPRMVGSGKEARRILLDSTAKEEGRIRMVTKSHDVIHPPLTSQRMGGIAASQLQHFSDFINKLPDGEEIDLYKSITREITAASMRTFYGPQNPFYVNPELIEAFWDWEGGLVAYMTGVLPQVFARKAHIGLEKCVQGFLDYEKRGGYEGAYELIQNRKRLHEATGISGVEHARLEIGISFAFNSNAGIVSFWVLNNIFSRPDLLNEIREEVRSNALIAPDTLSFTKLKECCPLLNSCYRESMRLIAPISSARWVLEDTMLADTYLLRKDTVVQIAGGTIHGDSSIWGPDVSSFNPRRFLYTPNGSKTNEDGSVPDSKASQVHAGAFRAFGGGASLCPGRHFAQMEILTMTAVFAWGFDLLPPVGKNEVAWNPPRDDKRFPIAVVKPLRRLDVRLKRREGMEDIKWILKV